MTGQRAVKTAALIEVNQSIREVARESPSDVPGLVWEFFCECGRPDCREHVFLTVEEYGAIHDGGSFVLADGHQPSRRQRALRLREDPDAAAPAERRPG